MLLAFPTTLLAAWYGGQGPGMLSVVANVAVELLLIDTARSLDRIGDSIRLAIYALSGILMSLLAGSLHRSCHRATLASNALARSTEILCEERKQAELALREAIQQSEAASRAKDEFLAMLGHELRNPLAPIVTAVQLIKMRGDVPSIKERTILERQSQHLLRLVDDLLDVSRIARGKIELNRQSVMLTTIVSKAIEMTSPLFELQQHALHVDVEPDLKLNADETRIVQVLSNLLTNAAKYTNRGGHVSLIARREAQEAVVRVFDNGIGISQELLPHVFELFVQGPRGVDRRQGGLGLGLSLVRSIVTLHGGTVAARSAGPQLGSEFEVRLPALSKENEDYIRDLQSSEPDRFLGNGARVMIVDDNADAADLLAEFITHAGYRVAVAHDAPEALALALQFFPDVAVLDIGLPVMDGYELAERLRQQLAGRALYLIALTGYGQDSDGRRSRSAGFSHHLVKPVDDTLLLHAIAEGTAASCAPQNTPRRGFHPVREHPAVGLEKNEAFSSDTGPAQRLPPSPSQSHEARELGHAEATGQPDGGKPPHGPHKSGQTARSSGWLAVEGPSTRVLSARRHRLA